MELIKKIVKAKRVNKDTKKEEDVTYVNFFLLTENGKTLPITITKLKDSSGKVLNPNDYAIACALAKKVD